MTDHPCRPNYVSACLVWVFPVFAVICIWAFDGIILWPSFITGALALLLIEICAAASWGFWTGWLT